jgi:hypothetical protein
MDQDLQIEQVSSVNLRMGRGEEKKLDEPIKYECKICRQRCKLGRDSYVMVRIGAKVGKNREEWVVCDDCVDAISDAIRFGPRAVSVTWKRSSRVARVSAVQEDLLCFKCLKRSSSHLFVKFDDLSVACERGSASYGTIRVCARCALAYMMMIEQLVRHEG